MRLRLRKALPPGGDLARGRFAPGRGGRQGFGGRCVAVATGWCASRTSPPSGPTCPPRPGRRSALWSCHGRGCRMSRPPAHGRAPRPSGGRGAQGPFRGGRREGRPRDGAGGGPTRVALGGPCPGARGDPAAGGGRAGRVLRRPLRRVVNGTGVVLHTNLGRAPLPKPALQMLAGPPAGVRGPGGGPGLPSSRPPGRPAGAVPAGVARHGPGRGGREQQRRRGAAHAQHALRGEGDPGEPRGARGDRRRLPRARR